jgi:hypothetical protein
VRSKVRGWSAAVCLGLSLGAAPAAARAQIGAGALTGRVLDPAGDAAPSALVTVTEASTRLSRTATTDDDGRYMVSALEPGTYRIHVALTGFAPLMRDGVRIATGETVRVDLTLEVEGLVESVTVTRDAPLIRSDAAGLGQVIDGRMVAALPLNGRHFVTLAGLSPAVALPRGSLLPRINGGRPRTNEYLFDGISVLQPEPGQVAFFPNIDAIQDFKIEINSPPAEFGRFNGGVVNLTTIAGGNIVHGTGFDFVRHEILNARPSFATAAPADSRFRRQQFGGVIGGPIRRDRTFFFVDYQGQRQSIDRIAISTVPTRLHRQGVFTEAIGGRAAAIYDPATTATGPGGGATRRPFPGNAIPLERMDPVALALLARYPLPTHEGTANNFRRVAAEHVDQDQLGARLDHRFPGNRDHVFGRLTRFHETFVPVAPLPDGSGAASGALGPQATTAWSFASSYRRTASSRLLNELRLGDTRRTVGRTAVDLGTPAAAALTLQGLPSTGRFATALPTFQTAGYQPLGSPPGTATDFGTSVTELADTLTWLSGRHTVKAGADLRWSRLDVVQPPSPTGLFTFTSLFTDLPGVAGTGTPLASFLLGQVQQFSIDLQQDPIRNRAHVQEYFVQDDWRASDRLTVNAGVRYTLNFPSIEKTNQAAVFNLETRQLDFLGRDGHPRSARRLHTHNLGPRLGVAARATDRMVVRASYGLVWIEMSGITTPFTTPVFPFLQTVSERSLDGVTPTFALADGPRVAPIPLTADAGLGQGVFAVDRDLGSGYVQQWSASLQRELGPHVAVEAAYVGSRISRVGVPDANLNQLTVDELALGEALLQRVPNPFFGTIPRSSSLGDPTLPLAQLLKPYPQHTTVSRYRHNIGTTRYDGIYVKIEQRLSGGLSYLASYTRSRLVDDASAVFDASILTGPVANAPVADSFNRALERDVSTGDMPHVLVASAVWDPPLGAGRGRQATGVLGAIVNDWTMTGVLTLQSGTPVAVTQATNHNAFAGFGTQRPNLVGDPALPAGERTVDRWFDTGAFQPAPPFTLGTASRNPVPGPAYINLALAVARRVPVGGRMALEVRAEVFNATNTPALGPPNGIFGSAAFGTITTAGDPRVVQLAVRQIF